MKTAIIAAVVATVGFAAPAVAWEGKVVACYDKVWVGPEYKVTKKLIRDGHYKWEHNKAHQAVKVWYPAIYEEIKTQTSNGYWLEVKAACR